MEFRLAEMNELEQIKSMYRDIILQMNQNGVEIWDEVYPCEFFKEDIQQKRLFVLVQEQHILSAFALCDTNAGETFVRWKDPEAKAFYIDRFGVNVHDMRKGFAGMMLSHAVKLAKENNIRYLRLFVVDQNIPAIQLYEKNGWQRVEGSYDEVIDEDLIFHEYGYEIDVKEKKLI